MRSKSDMRGVSGVERYLPASQRGKSEGKGSGLSVLLEGPAKFIPDMLPWKFEY